MIVSKQTVLLKLLNKDTKSFWKQIQQLNNKFVKPTATSIAGVSGTDNICNFWHEYFKDILNSSVNSKINTFNNVDIEDITPLEIKAAIKRLKKGTSAGQII